MTDFERNSRRRKRWSLRSQILVPFVALMIFTILVVSGVNAWLATRRAENEIETQLRDIASTLSDSTFPLGDAVLKQARGLSGVELAVSGMDARVVNRSDPALSMLPAVEALQDIRSLRLGKPIQVDGQTYFHAVVLLDRRKSGRELSRLHLLYPERKWRAARREAVMLPLAVGACAVLLVVATSAVIAGRVTRPIASLGGQVEAVTEGKFAEIPVPDRNDEIRDLADSVNRMTRMLARYEEEVRRHERLRTLGQLGGGIAHQMRNAATGCRMALDLHARDCSLAGDENLQVAARQLALMERYLQRFLTLGRHADAEPTCFAVQEVVNSVMPLVAASAQHNGTRLECHLPAQPLLLRGNQEDLEQVLVNLLLNAIEATADSDEAQVAVHVAATDNQHVQISVRDTGPGLADSAGREIFDPLVSSKPDGAGLGLSVVKEIVEHHLGSIHWRRDEHWTCFEVSLPSVTNETE